MPGIFRFVGRLFLSKKTVPSFLELISMLFLIFEKGIRKKLSAILRYLSMLFLIFEKATIKKPCQIF